MSKSFTLKTEHYLIFALLVALVLRLFHLNYDGLWNDELFTAISAHPKRSVGEVIAFIAELDIHPPFHNIITNLWSKLFGYNDTSLRLFNVLIGIWSVKSVFDLAKTLFSKKVAWYALGLAVVNYYMIMYSQEVRPYGLLFLLSNYSFYFFIKLIKNGVRLKYSLFYVLVTTAMLYTHYFATFIISAQFFTFIFVANWKLVKQFLFRYILTFGTPVLLFLFWVPFILDKLNDDRQNWRDDASIGLLLKYPSDFFNDSILGVISLAFILLTLVCLLIRKAFKHPLLEKLYSENHFALSVVISWIVVYFAVPFFRSLFYDTILYNRYFIPLVAPIILLLAFYLNQIKKPNLKNGIFVVVIGYSLLLLATKQSPYFTHTTTFREIAQEAKQIDPKAPVWYISTNPRLFEYYMDQNGLVHYRKQFSFFSKFVKRRGPTNYFVFVDLKLIPQTYSKEIPMVDGYELVTSKILKNKAGQLSTRLIHYKQTEHSINK